MSADKLALYNIALSAIGERSIATLSENREARRKLDEVWSRGQGAVRYFLEEGYWNHAIRAVQLDKSDSVTPSFGLANAFDKPTDFVRLVSITSDEHFAHPLLHFEIEAGFIYADIDPIYLRYISDDPDFGGDLSLWPETFLLWAGYYLATQIAPALKNDVNMDKLEERTRKYLIDARSKDAQQEPVRFPPLSSWANARLGNTGSRRDGGSRTRLIG
jgi:hypothetical protein